jgi:hypothetical protein
MKCRIPFFEEFHPSVITLFGQQFLPRLRFVVTVLMNAAHSSDVFDKFNGSHKPGIRHTQPYRHFASVCIDQSHNGHLLAALTKVVLIDTHGINPQQAVAIIEAQMFQSIE